MQAIDALRMGLALLSENPTQEERLRLRHLAEHAEADAERGHGGQEEIAKAWAIAKGEAR